MLMKQLTGNWFSELCVKRSPQWKVRGTTLTVYLDQCPQISNC